MNIGCKQSVSQLSHSFVSAISPILCLRCALVLSKPRYCHAGTAYKSEESQRCVCKNTPEDAKQHADIHIHTHGGKHTLQQSLPVF